jgi:hypothetical protein
MRLAVPIFLLIAGCASLEQESAQVRNAWQGVSYDEVVKRWGAPTRSATLQDGAQVHTWVSEESRSGSSGASVGMGVFGGSGGGGMGMGIGFPIGSSSRVEGSRCERTFTFKGGAVSQQSWIGEPGYCNSFRR